MTSGITEALLLHNNLFPIICNLVAQNEVMIGQKLYHANHTGKCNNISHCMTKSNHTETVLLTQTIWRLCDWLKLWLTPTTRRLCDWVKPHRDCVTDSNHMEIVWLTQTTQVIVWLIQTTWRLCDWLKPHGVVWLTQTVVANHTEIVLLTQTTWRLCDWLKPHGDCMTDSNHTGDCVTESNHMEIVWLTQTTEIVWLTQTTKRLCDWPKPHRWLCDWLKPYRDMRYSGLSRSQPATELLRSCSPCTVISPSRFPHRQKKSVALSKGLSL